MRHTLRDDHLPLSHIEQHSIVPDAAIKHF